MPSCEGRPDGRCPKNKDDETVKWSICDLFLCPECLEFRIPTIADNMEVLPAMSTLSTPVAGDIVRNELLCFIQQKSSVIAVDHITKICTDFYRKEEITAARVLMQQFVTQRISRRQGADASRSTVDDLIKLCLDPNLQIPTFCATDLSRLPPVDISHCDITALIKEIQALRSEVRQLADLRDEVDTLKLNLHTMEAMQRELQTIRLEVRELASVREEIENLKQATVKQSMANVNADCVSVVSVSKIDETSSKLFSRVADNFANAPERPFEQVRKKSKPRRSPLLQGKSPDSREMVADSLRKADLFMSRLHPTVSTDEVKSLVVGLFPGCSTVKVENLKARFDSYSSFHVQLLTPRSNFDKLIESIYTEDMWPAGILVRRFYNNKYGSKP